VSFLVAGIFFYFLDAKTVLALLNGAIRADRFCEGALFGFMKSGADQMSGCLFVLAPLNDLGVKTPV
jgi:hypothetical protein